MAFSFGTVLPALGGVLSGVDYSTPIDRIGGISHEGQRKYWVKEVLKPIAENQLFDSSLNNTEAYKEEHDHKRGIDRVAYAAPANVYADLCSLFMLASVLSR